MSLKDYQIRMDLSLSALTEVPTSNDSQGDRSLQKVWCTVQTVSPDPIEAEGELEPRESQTVAFKVFAPVHAQTEQAKDDLWNRWTLSDEDKIKALSPEALLKSYRLRWEVNACVTEFPEPLEAFKELPVAHSTK